MVDFKQIRCIEEIAWLKSHSTKIKENIHL
jgi:hypothetical protein